MCKYVNLLLLFFGWGMRSKELSQSTADDVIIDRKVPLQYKADLNFSTAFLILKEKVEMKSICAV